MEGSAAVPSTVDVYIDGSKTFSQSVDPGPYRLTNLPVYGRGGTARIVVRDALGRDVETSLPFVVWSTLLAPGLLDFSLEAGVPRLSYATETDSYVAQPIGTSSLRAGITDSLTIQAHGEVGAGLVNVGLGAALRVGSLGVVSGSLAGSQIDKRNGLQALLSVETMLGGVSLYGSTQRTFGDYEDLASVTARIEPGDHVWKGLGLRFNHGIGASAFVNWSAKPPRSVDQLSVSFPLLFDTSYVGASFIQRVDAAGHRSQFVSAS
jgi:outer membrane usher protein